MKITASQLRRIIKEEVQKVLFEEIDPNCPTCGGTGWREMGTKRDLGVEPCFECNPDGFENKDMVGEVDCEICGGSGVEPTSYDDPCAVCDGKGSKLVLKSNY